MRSGRGGSRSSSSRPRRWRTCTSAPSARWRRASMRHFWHSYRLILAWDVLRRRRILPMIVVIQVALSVGVVYGLAFLLPDIDARSALFLSTGAPTLSILILGLTVVPQEVAQGKL